MSAPDAAAGVHPPESGIFHGLTVVDSPPSTPKNTNNASPDKKVTEATAHGESREMEETVQNEVQVEDNTNSSGTPQSSSTNSEESAVLVEREDATPEVTESKGGEQEQEPFSSSVEPSNQSNEEGVIVDNVQKDNETTSDTADNEQRTYDSGNDSDNTNTNDSTVDVDNQTPTPPPPKIKERPPSTCFVHGQTPIPNSDSSLRILRKFIHKTAKHFPTSYGGTKSSSLMSYLFGGSSDFVDDECCSIYKDLADILSANAVEEDDDEQSEIEGGGEGSENGEMKENEVVIESILGHSGDTMSKARQAVAVFCRLVETWCLETARIRAVDVGGDLAEYEETLRKSHFYGLRRRDLDSDLYRSFSSSVVLSELVSVALSTAEALVAHGCFDGVMVGVGEEKNNLPLDMRIMPSITEESDDADYSPQKTSMNDPTFFNAVTVLAESIFLCHLNTEEVELAGLKFLLTTGCRTAPSTETGYNEAMLKGSQLLQTIRVCYRIYLSTESKANRTTAKAALRQIVTSAFKRLEAKNQVYHNTSSKAVVEKEGNDLFSHPALDDSVDRSRRGDERSYSGNFTTFEHKDAYLVLRSLCKLSMKATVGGGAFDNVVVTRNESSRSLETSSSSIRSLNSDVMPNQEMMIDPALDSKILALDLLVEILQGTKTDILLNAGPQLIYAVRNYLCHSLLKNCTSDNNYVVSLSLRLFVPIIRHFRSHLKTEIEAFVTNVFFVILDSKNSTVEHKLRVVILFEEICSDPATLAEIFLNYDCDLSAVDLFQRIVNTLAKVAKIGLHDQGMNSNGIFVAGAGVSRAERSRQELRELRLEAMKAVRQVLSSLHESFVSPILDNNEEEKKQDSAGTAHVDNIEKKVPDQKESHLMSPGGILSPSILNSDSVAGNEKQSLVQIYDSKKKRREEAAKATLRFNQKPTAGIKFATEVGIINGDDPADVAQFLLSNKDVLDKTQIGEYLGREPDYQNGYPLKVLHQYLNLLDFAGLLFDDAIKFYLSGFRLPGEAQKVGTSKTSHQNLNSEYILNFL